MGSVLYAAQNATSFVDGCTEQPFDGEVVPVAPANPSSTITLGLRMDGEDRQFEGAVLEVVAYPGTLDLNASAAVVHALQTTYVLRCGCWVMLFFHLFVVFYLSS